MKILLSLLIFISIGVSAQNNLVVFTQESKPFYVVVNGIRQNMTAETNVKIENLPGDFYRVKVVFADGQTPDVDQSVSFMEKNQEYSLEVRLKKGKYKMRFAGVRPINQSTNTGTSITYHEQEIIESNQNTTVQSGNNTGNTQENISSSSTQTNNVSGNANVHVQGNVSTNTTETNESGTVNSSVNMNTNENGAVSVNVNMSENGISMNMNVPEEESQIHSSSSTTSTNISSSQSTIENNGNVQINSSVTSSSTVASDNWQTNNQSNNQSFDNNSAQFSKVPSYTGYVNCNGNVMANVSHIISMASDEAFAEDQRNVIQSSVNTNCLSVEQVGQLASVFTHESDQLSFMKWAFNRTYDIDNFYKLSSQLTFSSSKEELDKFIDAQPTAHFTYVYSSANNDGFLIDAADLKKRMEAEAFSDDQLALAKQALVSRYISVSQVKSIMNVFSHESDVLKFLELAYPRTTDQENFGQLREKLTFDSNKKAFDKIIE